ncbi:MAG: hypothetical protein ISS43_00325 [Candidatus Omnitrophica bacterium]|nr:hypothetical protein [Candidatus Omnitrophota bacterium]
MSDSRDIGYAIFGFFFGIWGFFWGFKRLRRKRLIENIPTSTIRGLAMGLVELSGRAEKTNVLKSPLTNTECILYKYLVEEYRSSGKSGRWVTIASGNSFYSPFWLNDGTGKIMVLPQAAELFLPVDYEFRTGIRRTMPATLVEFMEKNGIRYKGWLSRRSLRFKEWFICPDENVYVLGSAKKTDIHRKDYRDQLTQRIKELKEDPQKMKEVDLDKDGQISMQEWDSAVAKMEQTLLEETLKNAAVENPTDVMIGKGEVETVFVISDHSEKELTKRLSRECLLGIFGGAALSLVLLGYLLVRLGLFKF